MRWMSKKAPPDAGDPRMRTFGARLAAALQPLHRALHGDPESDVVEPLYRAGKKASKQQGAGGQYRAPRKHATLLHGDYKAANMFVRAGGAATAGDGDASADVAVCDFQFAGPGLAAVDIMYLLFADARAEFFDSEESLLDG